jgi:non-ribosomal peptide synthetase component E (peptide arylation enzyme)
MAEGLVNYTRLNDSPERIINTQGCPMCPDDEVWWPMRRVIRCRAAKSGA